MKARYLGRGCKRDQKRKKVQVSQRNMSRRERRDTFSPERRRSDDKSNFHSAKKRRKLGISGREERAMGCAQERRGSCMKIRGGKKGDSPV